MPLVLKNYGEEVRRAARPLVDLLASRRRKIVEETLKLAKIRKRPSKLHKFNLGFEFDKSWKEVRSEVKKRAYD